MHTLVSREKAVVCAYLGEQGEGCADAQVPGHVDHRAIH